MLLESANQESPVCKLYLFPIFIMNFRNAFILLALIFVAYANSVFGKGLLKSDIQRCVRVNKDVRPIKKAELEIRRCVYGLCPGSNPPFKKFNEKVLPCGSKCMRDVCTDKYCRDQFEKFIIVPKLMNCFVVCVRKACAA